jgi:hypothetical protein
MNQRRYCWIVAVLFVIALFASTFDQAAEHSFIGSKKCRTCHIKEHKSWAETKMAKAFEALRPGVSAEAKEKAGLDPQKDYTKDETCLPCHTTGYGGEGGFNDEDSTPTLVGVGCEMCHGAGGTYTKKELMSLQNKEYEKGAVVAAGMVDIVTVAQCKNCHNKQSPFVGDDYVFDFEANKDEGTHEKYPLKYKH